MADNQTNPTEPKTFMDFLERVAETAEESKAMVKKIVGDRDPQDDSPLYIAKETKEDITEFYIRTKALYESLAKRLARLQTTIDEGIVKYRDRFFSSEEWARLQKAFPGITEGQGFNASFIAQEILEYLPEIQEQIAEIEAREGKPLDVNDLFFVPPTFMDSSQLDETLEYPGPEPLITALLDKAIEIRKRRELAAAPRITPQKPDTIHWQTDKVNSMTWSPFLFLKEDTGGQLTLPFAMESEADRKKGRELTLIYSIDFGALEEAGTATPRRLTQIDKLIYIAISALYNAGNKIVTATQIHYAMGNTTRPKDGQLEKIRESVVKMARAWITVDDMAEHTAYKHDIDEHREDGVTGWKSGRYEGSLLPAELQTAIVNGRPVVAFHIFREPPMMTFAKLRGQVTALNIGLLQSPVNKTERNLAIQDYILVRIARAKNREAKKRPRQKRAPEKILLETLYTNADIKDKKAKQRAPKMVERYLEHFKKEGYIMDYKLDPATPPKYVTISFEVCQ